MVRCGCEVLESMRQVGGCVELEPRGFVAPEAETGGRRNLKYALGASFKRRGTPGRVLEIFKYPHAKINLAPENIMYLVTRGPSLPHQHYLW